jgi:hypothetical protein
MGRKKLERPCAEQIKSNQFNSIQFNDKQYACTFTHIGVF